ncbi:MAG: ParB N-terminal domain-containing protein [Polyangiaceae bacterium]|jgi:ParB-like chromosome segregation protein Spo0J|nr:ParB N-terminal domain-containing protein [Polyangiaceae bacterium]
MYEDHPASELFPLMDNVALAALIRDIKANGLQEPIVLWEGKILDGRNRLKACERAGVEPRFRELDTCDSPTAAVVSANLFRRHLSVSQRAMVGALAKREFAKEARKRQEATRLRPGGKSSGRDSEHQDVAPAILPGPVQHGDARALAAASVGVSPRTIDAASHVLESGPPDLSDAVRAGKMSVSRAAKLVSEPPPAASEPAVSLSLPQAEARIRRCDPKAFLDTVRIETADLLISRPTFDTTPDHYEAHAQYWLGEAVAPMKYTSRIFLVCDPDIDMVHALAAACRRQAQFKCCHVMTWSQSGPARGTPGYDYRAQHKVILHLRGLDAPVLDAKGSREATTVHRDCPTIEALAERLIRHTTKPGDLVIDPCAERGEILFAAARLGRRALGATLNEACFNAAVRAGCIADG